MKDLDDLKPNFDITYRVSSNVFPKAELDIMQQIAGKHPRAIFTGSTIRRAALMETRKSIDCTSLRLFLLREKPSDLDVVLRPTEIPNSRTSRSDPRLVSATVKKNGTTIDYLGWLPSDEDATVACIKMAATTALALSALVNHEGGVIILDPYDVLRHDPHDVCRPLNLPIDPCHYNSENVFRATRAAILILFGYPLMSERLSPEMDHNLHLLAKFYNPSLSQAESLIELLLKLSDISSTISEDAIFANYLFTSGLLRVLAASALTIFEANPNNNYGINLVTYYVRRLLLHSNEGFPAELFPRFYSGSPFQTPPQELSLGLMRVADYGSRYPIDLLLVDVDPKTDNIRQENSERLAQLDSIR